MKAEKNKPKVLIVDDERENLTSFKYLFDDIYDVYLAESAAEGREILSQHEIHVVITDQRMPEVTGVEFLEQVLKDYPDTIRMILTGYSDFDAIIQAINKGQIYYYFSKPWNEMEMQMIIDNALEAVQLRQDLRQNKECFIELSNNISEVFWLVSPDWKTLNFISPTLEYAFGSRLEKLEENPLQWVEFVFPDDAEQVDAFIEETRRNPDAESHYVEFRISLPDASIRWLSFRLFPVKDHSGATYRYAGLMENMTEQIIQSKTRAQSEQMSSFRSFASGLAHELNNPLSSVINCAQIINKRLETDNEKNLQIAVKNGIDLLQINQFLADQKILDRLSDIRTAGIRASAILKNMLSDDLDGSSNKKPKDMEALLNNMVSMVRSDPDLNNRYNMKNLNIRKSIEPSLPPVFCNEIEIGQVIFNLLKNAVQAVLDNTADGDGEIQLRAGSLGDEVLIEVADNGPGMEPAVTKRVFEPFFTTKSKSDGTGLGLSIAHRIITFNHNGTISVRSRPGQGTIFTIQLKVNTP